MDEAIHYAKDALYWMGWYFENPRLYAFDTALEVLNSANDTSIYEITKDFIFLYESSSEEEKQRYKKRYTQTKHMLSITFYKSDGEMRRFLRKLNKQNILEDSGISKMEIFNILHSKVKSIRGDTIRRILKRIDIKDFQIDSLPSPFWIEFVKMKDGLEDGIDAVINGRQTLDPYVKARLDLEREFLGRMPERVKENFIKAYLNLDKDERRVMDRFARDYIRYDIKWGMRIKAPDEMEEYAKLFHLKKMPAALAYWSYDDEDGREKLVRTLGRVRESL